MIVVKFGGTSLAGTERMRAAARIVAAARRDSSVVCVVSALAGVTDTLLRITEQVTAGGMTGTSTGMTTGATTTTALSDLRTRHQRVLTALTTAAPTPEQTSFITRFETLLSALENDLVHLRALPSDPPDARANAIPAGESATMQRRMYAALWRATGATQPEHIGETGTCEMVERRRTS